MRDFESFLDYEKQKTVKVAERVAADPYIFAALKNWQRLTISERKGFFSDYARIYARASGLGFVSLEEYQEPPSADGRVELGHHADEGGWLGGSALRLNTHLDVLAKVDVGRNINTLSHELTHEHQRQIIKDPDILPHRFRATIAPLFERNAAHYISPKLDYKGYREQPLERHAIIVGDLVSRTIMEFMAGHESVKHLYKEAEAQAQFERGYVSIGQSDGIEERNPYLHFYAALLKEGKLAFQPKNPSLWFEVFSGYKSAIKYGEYLAPYNPTIPMEKLGQLAVGMIDVEVKGQEKPREINVPEDIKRQALEHLKILAQSKRTAVRLKAEHLVRTAERWAAPEAPKGGNARPLAEHRA